MSEDLSASSAPAPEPGSPSVGSSPSATEAPSSEGSPSVTQTYKQMVAGEEKEFTIEELQKYAGMGFDANSKWEEAANLRKHNDNLLKKMKDNPKEFFAKHAKQFGFDLDAYSMEALAAQVDADLQAEAEAAMTPEERQFRQDQKELEQFRSEKKLTLKQREEESEREAEQSQVQADQQYEADTRQSIQDGLKQSGLPYTNFTWNSVLQYMGTAMDAGHEDVTPEQVMHLVKRDYQRSFDGLFEGSEDEIISRLGDDKIARIQSAVIKRAKGPGHRGEVETVKAVSNEPQDFYSWEKQLEEVKQKIRRGEI